MTRLQTTRIQPFPEQDTVWIMKAIMIFLLLAFASAHAQQADFTYLSPKPNSNMVTPETNVILRHARHIDPATLQQDLILVKGSSSGIHEGEFLLADDGKTLVFNPRRPFAHDERVTVTLLDGLESISGDAVLATEFEFATAPDGITQYYYDELTNSLRAADALSKSSSAPAASNLPPPDITINSIDNPSPGYIFMATWDRNTNPRLYGNFIFVLDNRGNIVDSVRVDGPAYDLQVQPNGLLSYAQGGTGSSFPLPDADLQYIILDTSLAVVDRYQMKNGYATDFHEFLMLPNGNVIMMSYHTILYDMSRIQEGGKTDASLVINVIQEQDRDRNVVFEWRNIDYIPITDSDLDLTVSRINYGTLNAYAVDNDGHLLASFRNHSEIMKISRTTGEVLWRMGSPRGEFEFVGENEASRPYYFSRQHNILRLPNGNVSLFDNGQFHSPPYSRAVEYSLDEENKVATLVSEWRYPNGNIFSLAAGNAQRLPDGGWFIGYGIPSTQNVVRNAVEVHPDGSIALELTLPRGVLAYRITKSPWKETVVRPSFTHIEVIEGSTYSFNDTLNTTGVEIQFAALNAADYNEATITRVPYGPVAPQFFGGVPTVSPVSLLYSGFGINSHTSVVQIDLAVYPEVKASATTSVYWREFPNQGLFLQLPAAYDSVANTLSFQTAAFGEFVFGNAGFAGQANAPIPYEPADNRKILPLDSLALRWTGQGTFDAFRVQIATDSLFGTTIVDSTLNAAFLYLDTLANFTTYYWRVKSILGIEESGWSPVMRFETTDPFITLVAPAGGEAWQAGSTEIVRWETNILDSVQIVLLADQDSVIAVGELTGKTMAFEWQIPTDLRPGSGYAFRIESLADSTVFAISANTFSITDATTSVAENLTVEKGFELHQNYPNPFNPTTVIGYQLPVASRIELSIYSLLGRKVATLANKTQPAGSYKVNWNATGIPAGIYVFKLETDRGFRQTRKLVLLK